MRSREIIGEIISIDGRDEYVSNKNYLFNNIAKTKTPVFDNGKSYYYSIAMEYDVEHHALLENDNIIALLRLENSRLNKNQVLSTQVEQSLRGLGLMRYLFNKALDIHGEIYSDTHQSAEVKHFWQMLIVYPESRYSIYIYNPEDNTLEDTRDYIGNVEKTVWNQQENPILVCIKRKYTIDQLLINEHNNNIRKKVNRDDWSLWYKKSNTKGYENP